MSSSQVLHLLGWWYLPDLVTGWTQTIYYSITVRAGDPKPAPGSERFIRHRRRIHVLVVSLYLLYTVYEAYLQQQSTGSFYSDLGVPFGASDKEIKSRFRRVAAQHHPDKAGGAAGGSSSADTYMYLKTASETLTTPARRFAYERFGPDIVDWQHCTTVTDYLMRGAQELLPHYVGAIGVLSIMSWLGYLDYGRHWRWMLALCMCVFELHVVTRPRSPWILDHAVNPLLLRLSSLGLGGPHQPLLPYQLIALLRSLSVTFSVALSQIGPRLATGGTDSAGNKTKAHTGGAADRALLESLNRLEESTAAVDGDAARLFELQMHPYAARPELVSSLRGKVRDWLVQNTIRSDPMVRDALGNNYRKRRTDAPVGAKGTK